MVLQNKTASNPAGNSELQELPVTIVRSISESSTAFGFLLRHARCEEQPLPREERRREKAIAGWFPLEKASLHDKYIRVISSRHAFCHV